MKLFAVCSLFVACVLHVIFPRFANRLGLRKPNFLGNHILTSYGIVLLADISALTGIFVWTGSIDPHSAAIYLSVMAAMCLLGFLDDVFGNRDVSGFRGHFRKLIVERKMTTGALKAIGGGIVGITTGGILYSGDPLRWITCALLIPLCANFTNILDLRPGRATAVFLFALGVTWCLVASKLPSFWLLVSIALPVALWGIADSLGKAMMGDSGSNCLGAALGLTLAIGTGIATQALVLCALVVVHWYSERYSITRLIESNRILNAIDRHLGAR